jgi:hypothetical protein
MTPSHPASEAWAQWWNELDTLAALLRRGKSIVVRAKAAREQTKVVVQHYFRQLRPKLLELSMDAGRIEELDWISQYLLKLAAGTSRRSTYRTRLRELSSLRGEIEAAIEIRGTARAAAPASRLLTATEAGILQTLNRVLPRAALSYEQVLEDLAAPRRFSYRGTAAELREVLRELLDHLAPDEDVLTTVKLERDQRGPTMKQKAVFILKARGIGESSRKTPVDAVGVVEDSIGSFTRSVYTRGSVSTHVTTPREEVVTIKGYADAVLADLLQIHGQRDR